ncbi:hypothetical protein ANCCEY_11051 [Ancylostoma ceylanicum]|uniref:Uncharacterized protein n=1 Tax=Ancylostoma ceylanicum TaxID=53326 RepID=A0A0D6LQD8_9BILA|nr:hypothetical protein ANCCEY_11051 [Ancylostoma ceylanicum]
MEGFVLGWNSRQGCPGREALDHSSWHGRDSTSYHHAAVVEVGAMVLQNMFSRDPGSASLPFRIMSGFTLPRHMG